MGFVVYMSPRSRTVRIHRNGCVSLQRTYGYSRSNDQWRVTYEDAETYEAARAFADMEGKRRAGARNYSNCRMCLPDSN